MKIYLILACLLLASPSIGHAAEGDSCKWNGECNWRAGEKCDVYGGECYKP